MEFENTTDTLDWVSRLAGALDDLSRAVMAVRINLPTLTNSQYRDLAENANRSHDAHLLFEAYSHNSTLTPQPRSAYCRSIQ